MASHHHRPGLHPAHDAAGYVRYGVARQPAARAHVLHDCVDRRAADLAQLRSHDPQVPLLGVCVHLCAKVHPPERGLHGGLVLLAGLPVVPHGQHPAGKHLPHRTLPRRQPLGLDHQPVADHGGREPARRALRRQLQQPDRAAAGADHRLLHRADLPEAVRRPERPGRHCPARPRRAVELQPLLERQHRNRRPDHRRHHPVLLVHRLRLAELAGRRDQGREEDPAARHLPDRADLGGDLRGRHLLHAAVLPRQPGTVLRAGRRNPA